MENLQKLKIKVISDLDENKIIWVHVAQIDKELSEQFFRLFEIKMSDLNSYLSYWAKEDFGYVATMTRKEHLIEFKKLVLQRYKVAYPELFRGNEVIDSQGWFRVYVSERIRKEVEHIGKFKENN